jgi:ATP-dependent DNA ligase
MKFKEFIYFYPEKPVLVHRDQPLVDKFTEDPDYVAEIKVNGNRCILVILNHEVSFFNRHGKEMRNIDKSDERYKEMVKEIKRKVPDTGHYQFEGEFRHNKVKGIQYRLVLWDCLIYNDEYLNKLTYDERREFVLKHFSVDDAEGYQIGDNIISLKAWADYRKSRVTVIKQYNNVDFRKLFEQYKLKHWDGKLEEFEGLVFKNRNGKLGLGRKNNPDSKWMFKIRIETGRHKF